MISAQLSFHYNPAAFARGSVYVFPLVISTLYRFSNNACRDAGWPMTCKCVAVRPRLILVRGAICFFVCFVITPAFYFASRIINHLRIDDLFCNDRVGSISRKRRGRMSHINEPYYS